MSCPHDWQVVNASNSTRVCTLCAAVDVDQRPPVRISDGQAAALGFTRNSSTGLLLAKTWTFPDSVFRPAP